MTTVLTWYCVGYALASHIVWITTTILDHRRARQIRRRWRGNKVA